MAARLIGQVAATVGLKPRTLRYYESLGLLPPPARTLSGYRLYGEDTLQRLAFIAKAKSLGLTLREIREILALRDRGQIPCPTVQRMLKGHLRRIDEQMARLGALKEDLLALMENWEKLSGPPGLAKDPTICPRLEAYGTPQKKHPFRKGSSLEL